MRLWTRLYGSLRKYIQHLKHIMTAHMKELSNPANITNLYYNDNLKINT